MGGKGHNSMDADCQMKVDSVLVCLEKDVFRISHLGKEER